MTGDRLGSKAMLAPLLPPPLQKPCGRNKAAHELSRFGIARQRPSGFVACPASAGRLEGNGQTGPCGRSLDLQLDVRLTRIQDLLLCKPSASALQPAGGPDSPLGLPAPEPPGFSRAMPGLTSGATCGWPSPSGKRILAGRCSIASKTAAAAGDRATVRCAMTAAHGCHAPTWRRSVWWAVGLEQFYQLWAGAAPRTHLTCPPLPWSGCRDAIGSALGAPAVRNGNRPPNGVRTAQALVTCRQSV